MIAVLYAQTVNWLPASGVLLTQYRDTPFSVEALTCACHGLTWIKSRTGERLVAVGWPD